MQLNNSTQARRRAQQDSRFRREESLRYLCPDDPNLPYDMTEVIKKVVDEGNFFEVRVDFGDWIGLDLLDFGVVHRGLTKPTLLTPTRSFDTPNHHRSCPTSPRTS